MATIGSYYVRVLPDMSGFNAPLVRTLGSTMDSAGNNAGNTFSRSFLGFVKRVAIGTTIGRLVTNGFNTIVNGFTTGIERLDIIENYPNIMANLGIANEDAQRSVERLQEALLGLPTSLQSGVQATTRLTTALGDIDRSTDAFIAFNNALVAGMAPASQQASALEQFSQAVAKGKPDMIEWRAMLAAMPGQMMQIAQSFGLTTDELGAALRTGNISMDEFLDHIIQLNKSGIGEFESFETQARGATATIGTALTNVGNRVAAGWAEIFKVFGQSNIAQFIDGIATGILNGFKAVAGAMQWIKDAFADSGIGAAFDLMGAQIDVALDKIGKGIEFSGDLFRGIIDIITSIVSAIADSGVILIIGDVVRTAIDWFNILCDTIKSIPFDEIFAGFIDTVSTVGTVVSDVFGSIVDYISGLLGQTDLTPVSEMFENIGTYVEILQPYLETASTLWTAFTDALSNLVTTVGPVVLDFFSNVGSALGGAFENFITTVAPMVVYAFSHIGSLIMSIVPFVVGLGNAFLALAGGAVTVVSDILSVVIPFLGNLLSAIIDFVGNVITTIVSVGLDIIGTLSMVAEAIINIILGIPQFFGELIAAVSGLVSIIIEFFLNLAASIFNTVVTIVANVIKFFSDLPGALRNIWMNIKATAINTWNNIKTSVATVISSIVSTVTSKFQSIKTTVSTTFSNIKSAITTPLNAAKDAVKSIIDKIKGFFNFSVSWPHIPVPSFGITPSGWSVGDLLKGVIPHLSISWHAKGGIIDGATLYGVGEKGAELVWPSYEPYLSKYASAIADNMDGGVTNNYYIDGTEVAANAKVAAALETVAEYANTRARMGVAVRG